MADLTAADLENLHKIVEQHFKITLGVKDKGLLDAIANRPSHASYGNEPFPDIFSKAASIMEAIIRWHPFADGNKRTALIAVSAYLDINEYVLYVPLSAVRYTVLIAKNRKTDQNSNDKLIREIADWIKRYSARKDDLKRKEKVLNSVRREYIVLQALGRSRILKKLAEFSVNRWLAIDIYPEYAAETQNIVTFLGDLITRNIQESREK